MFYSNFLKSHLRDYILYFSIAILNNKTISYNDNGIMKDLFNKLFNLRTIERSKPWSGEENMKLTIKIKIVMIVLTILAVVTATLILYAKNTYGASLEVNLNMISSSENNDIKLVKQEEEVIYLSNERNGDFKILAFTDMHFDGMDKKAMDKTMEEFLNALEEERPDLVIFTGDIITAIFNQERAKTIADIMETYGIYWCAILGNHEGEHPLSFSRENLIKLWANTEKYPHCLVRSGPKDIFGYGNYVVNLLDPDHNLFQSLIFLDSGDYVAKEDGETLHISEKSYDYIKADQIEWYKEQINKLPVGTKSSLFIHIPLCEYAIGWDAIYDETSKTIRDTDDCKYFDGMQREAVCCSEYNSGLFAVMLSLGSTQAVYCGHDHVNDYSISYKGIMLNYLQASGYSTYGWNEVTETTTSVLEEQSLQGYTILEMKTDGECRITRKRYRKDQITSN